MEQDKTQYILKLGMVKFLSGFVGYLYDISVVIYLFSERGSTAMLSGFFISRILPALLILFTGITIDKYDKKKLLMLTYLIRIGLFILLFTHKSYIAIFVTTFMLGILDEYEYNTFNALIPKLFTKENLIKVSSIFNVIDSASMIMGPIIASVLIMYSDVSKSIIINIFTSFLITFLYVSIRLPKTISNTTKEDRAKVKWHGFKVIFQDKNIRAITIKWICFMFVIGLTSPLEVMMIENVLGESAELYGVGNAVFGLGMLLSSFLVLKLNKKLTSYWMITVGFLISVFGYFIIGVSQNILTFFTGLFLIGWTASFAPIGFRTSIQVYGSENKLGRIFSTSRFLVIFSRIIGTSMISVALVHFSERLLYVFASFFLLSLVIIDTTTLTKS